MASAALLGAICTGALSTTRAGEAPPSGVSQRAGCSPSLVTPPRAPAYADTTWPTEHADPWRTHAVAAGLQLGRRPVKLETRSATLPPSPVWGYTSPDGKVYVLGGAPYLLGVFTELMLGAPPASIPLLVEESKRYSETVTPYVARIDPRKMSVDVLELTLGTSVNYIGGMLVHENGFLYAVARSVLYKIDPRTFTVVASASLPLAPTSSGDPNEMTAYNGMQATDDGALILKGWASTGGGSSAPGIMLRVDPRDLSIRVKLVTTVVAAARMVVATVDGKEYAYFPGKTESLRFLLEPTAFVLDDAFTETYLTPGSGATEASSDVFMGKGVVFSDNTAPDATAPMHLFAEAATGSPLQKVQAFRSSAAGWNFFMVAGDPFRSGIVVVQDQLSGHLAGYLACDGGQTVEKLWENDSIRSSAGLAIDYRNGDLYTDDRRCAKRECDLFLVVADLHSGREKARVAVKGKKPSIGQIFIGPDNAVYYTATDAGNKKGYVTRVTTR